MKQPFIPSLALVMLLLNTVVLAQPKTTETYATSLPPAAELHYSIKARQSGFSLDGEALVNWQPTGQKPSQNYSIKTETRAALLGKILQADSTGTINSHGLAPTQFDEKRLGKPASMAQFDREKKLLHFSDSTTTYPLTGGEQDRTSAIWQLVSIARAESHQFIAGSHWIMFVAGRHDAENWLFNVEGNETISTPMGMLSTVHLVKTPPPDASGQRLDIWLAPGMEWYPVRLKFTDSDGDMIEQNLVNIKAGSTH